MTAAAAPTPSPADLPRARADWVPLAILPALVLVALPFAAALGLTAVNAEYMRPLYTTTTGHVLIGIALAMMAVGSLLPKRIVSPGR